MTHTKRFFAPQNAQFCSQIIFKYNKHRHCTTHGVVGKYRGDSHWQRMLFSSYWWEQKVYAGQMDGRIGGLTDRQTDRQTLRMAKPVFTFFTHYSCVNRINEAWMNFGLNPKPVMKSYLEHICMPIQIILSAHTNWRPSMQKGKITSYVSGNWFSGFLT
jgi:hypothetical protein